MGSVFYSKEPVVLTNKVGSDEPPKEVCIVDNVQFETDEPCETSFKPGDFSQFETSFDVSIKDGKIMLTPIPKQKLPRKAKKKFKKLARQYVISQCAYFWGHSMTFYLNSKYRIMRIKVSNKDLRKNEDADLDMLADK